MNHDPEILDFLQRHIKSILENDVETYHATTHPDLTLYEWWITPNRIDGLDFHAFMMESNAARGTFFGSGENPVNTKQPLQGRFDLANLQIQRYGDTAIASYTLLSSSADEHQTRVSSHHESRVMVKFPQGWLVVHVHKSPAWKAPYQASTED